MASVTIGEVHKSFGPTHIIKGVSVDIKDGEFCVLVGPSGCGKSTLLRMIAGLEEISGGTISIGNKVVNDMPPKERDIAMVFQNYALYPHMTVRDNMAFSLMLAKQDQKTIDASLAKAAEILGLNALMDRFPRQLSGGQRQRVAMGRAIVRDSQVFLFDEPLSNLDAQLRGEMRSEIKKLHQRLGATIIYVTHDQVEAMTLADRIAVLSGGHKMQYASPDQIYNRPAAQFVAGFTGSPPMNLLPCSMANGFADVGGAGVALPADLWARGAAADRHVFGIRPENIALAPREGQAQIAMNAQVVITEPLGAETLVTFQVGQAELVARCAADFKAPAGSAQTIYLDASALHLFNAATGQAL